MFLQVNTINKIKKKYNFNKKVKVNKYMKDRILRIKINPKYNLGYCILFLYKDNKYMFHTYEETEVDYVPETYTALSKYIIRNNHAELETIDVVETHLFLKYMIKEKIL